MKHCSKCNGEFDEKLEKCPFCGEPSSKAAPNYNDGFTEKNNEPKVPSDNGSDKKVALNSNSAVTNNNNNDNDPDKKKKIIIIVITCVLALILAIVIGITVMNNTSAPVQGEGDSSQNTTEVSTDVTDNSNSTNEGADNSDSSANNSQNDSSSGSSSDSNSSSSSSSSGNDDNSSSGNNSSEKVKVNGKEYKVGDTVKFTATLSKIAKDVCAISTQVNYDSDVLELVEGSITTPNIPSAVVNAKVDDMIVFNATSLTDPYDFSGEKVLVYIEFKVKGSKNSTTIEPEVLEIYDFDVEELDYTLNSSVK